MFFDDRLATVLRQRAQSESGVRTQFRQLLDILGNGKYGQDNSLIAAAWLRMDALAKEIAPEIRAMMIREPGWRFRSADLAAHLADFEPEVASCALNRADLSSDQWTALIPNLPVRARGFLRLRRDLPVDVERLLEQLGVHDRGLPMPEGLVIEAPELSEPDGEPVGDELRQGKPVETPPNPLELTDAVDESPVKDTVDTSSDASTQQPPETATAAASNSGPPSEIAALVERIAQFKRGKDTPAVASQASPRLPLGEQPQAEQRAVTQFGFAADTSGRIEWAEAFAAPMVIGKRLVTTRALGASYAASSLETAFRGRQPIEHARLTLEGADAIAGDWIVDAQPRFADGGYFAGYLGRFRRPAEHNPAHSQAAQEADRIRQLLHELRTPVTAIQGYAEVIQQQLFGPAPHEYRALAAGIAADAAHILAGLEELDRLAKLETRTMDIIEGETNLAAQIEATCLQLERVLAPRMAGIELICETETPVLIGIDEEETAGLLWRLLATLAGGCTAGEIIICRLRRKGGIVQLVCELPAQLLAEEDVFSAEVHAHGGTVNPGLFGAGFTLRLARAEARAAGGGLAHNEDYITLSLPILTSPSALRSQDA